MKYTLENVSKTPIVLKVEPGLKVTVNGLQFKDNLISQIVIFKFDRSDEPEMQQLGSSIFVELYMGNIEIASWIVGKVVIAEDRFSGTSEREGQLYGYTIRLPRNYD